MATALPWSIGRILQRKLGRVSMKLQKVHSQVARSQSRRFEVNEVKSNTKMFSPDTSKVSYRIVHTTSGGYTNGESGVGHLFGIDEMPKALQPKYGFSTKRNSNQVREEIDLQTSKHSKKLAFKIRHVLKPNEADAIWRIADQVGYTDFLPDYNTPPGMRQNVMMSFIDDGNFTDAVFERIKDDLPKEIDGRKLVGLSRRWGIGKYYKGKEFTPHIDGDMTGHKLTKDKKGIERYAGEKVHTKLSALFYLNDYKHDGVIGGGTKLFKGDYSDSESKNYYEQQPEKGTAIFFRHGIPGSRLGNEGSVMHAGSKSLGDTPKVMVRVDVLYEAKLEDNYELMRWIRF
mmetsp:Transcript_24345/g.36530  ORF Transcript_24345/g.36530 Transcript_24345/m.36530 type:complete len:344 (-) Transcript_24345:145-1176(-)